MMTDSMANVTSGSTATNSSATTSTMATGRFAFRRLMRDICEDLPVTVVNCLREFVTF